MLKISNPTCEYMEKPLGIDERQKLSDSFRQAAMPFSEEEQVARFKSEYSKLLQLL